MVDTKVWPAAVVAILALIICTGILLFFMPAVPDIIEAKTDPAILASITDISNKVDTLTSIVNTISQETTTPETPETPDRLTEAVDKILSRDDEKAIIEIIATNYLSTKEFKKALMNFLNDEDQSIENYKDIKDIVVKDIDIDYNDGDDEATVTFELKVTYFNDGDNDEEDAEKAKVEVTLDLEELDEDEDFIDAEVIEPESSDFGLIKFY